MSEHLVVPPNSIEAEQCVLGAVLLDNTAMDRIDGLRPDEFYNQAHHLIFEAAQRAWNAGHAFDVVTIADDMKRLNKLDFVGGLQYLGALVNAVPGAGNVRRYAEFVRDRAKRRGLLAVSFEINGLANEAELSGEQAIAEAQARLGELAELGISTGFVPFAEPLVAAAERSTDPTRRALQGLMPNSDLERILGGCEPGSLIIVAARPSVGKSVFGLQAALLAARAGYLTAFYSLEMPSEQLAMRALSACSSVPLADIREGKARDSAAAISDVMCHLAELPIKIDDTGALHVNQIRARARALHRRHAVGLIVIDYLTLVRGDGEKTTDRVGDVSQKLKALAKELGCVIMALSQMSRDCEKRPDKRGQLSDLRDSGEVEQAADVVIFLYRDELHFPGTPNKGVIEMIVRKNRHGSLGTAYGLALLHVSRIDEVPRGFQPAISATRSTVRSRGNDLQGF